METHFLFNYLWNLSVDKNKNLIAKLLWNTEIVKFDNESLTVKELFENNQHETVQR